MKAISAVCEAETGRFAILTAGAIQAAMQRDAMPFGCGEVAIGLSNTGNVQTGFDFDDGKNGP